VRVGARWRSRGPAQRQVGRPSAGSGPRAAEMSGRDHRGA
jgi:hypothetical protein